MNKDYYAILGIDRNASDKDIKKAFREMSKKYHPDVCKEPDAEVKFKEINDAYQVLSDKEKKAMYDQYGTVDPNEIPSSSGLEDFFSGMFGGMFGGRRSGGTQKEVGSDLHITIKATYKDIYDGAYKKIRLKKDCTCARCHGSGSEDNTYESCPKCNGTGTYVKTINSGGFMSRTVSPCDKCNGTGKFISNPCYTCHGTGLVKEEREVSFNIPKGMYYDAQFVVQGEGNMGPHRGIPGNLRVSVIEADENAITGLKRDKSGLYLLYKLTVPFTDLVFGCDKEVPWLDGTKQKIHLEKGTPSGKIITLYRKGFPDPNDNLTVGDYLITVECEIPKKITKEQKEILEKYKDTL